MNTIQSIEEAYKLDLYHCARDRLISWYGPEMAETGGCLYWAQVTMRTLLIARLRPVLQAGDMLWPIRTQDDGLSSTHFGYCWNPIHTLSQAALVAGRLPEVHVWVALPDSREIVDFSTGSFKRLAEERHHLKWDAPPPPLFLWGSIPEGCRYWPYPAAIQFVLQLLLNS